MENHHFSWENSRTFGDFHGFSIVMLNYQRVIQKIQILRWLSHVIPIIILIDSLPLMASRKGSHGTRGAASGPVSESCHPPDKAANNVSSSNFRDCGTAKTEHGLINVCKSIDTMYLSIYV